ncbi:MAG: hypothetical protein NVV82_13665 [Sporocytophaga sp.]|nr:hypothetical protein [Sporocytophaga sp.]
MYSVLIKWIKGVFLSAIFIAFFHEVNGQNNLYAIALKEFLSDSIKIDRYNVYEEHIKYNSVLVSLEGNRFNLPSSCLGYNLEYTSECDICDLITKKERKVSIENFVISVV